MVDQDGSWCCLTVGQLVRAFSTNGASATLDTADDGRVYLDVKDPVGRWHGWTAMTLELRPAGEEDMTGPLTLGQVQVDGNVVAAVDGSQSTAALLRQTFDLHRR